MGSYKKPWASQQSLLRCPRKREDTIWGQDFDHDWPPKPSGPIAGPALSHARARAACVREAGGGGGGGADVLMC